MDWLVITLLTLQIYAPFYWPDLFQAHLQELFVFLETTQNCIVRPASRDAILAMPAGSRRYVVSGVMWIVWPPLDTYSTHVVGTTISSLSMRQDVARPVPRRNRHRRQRKARCRTQAGTSSLAAARRSPPRQRRHPSTPFLPRSRWLGSLQAHASTRQRDIAARHEAQHASPN